MTTQPERAGSRYAGWSCMTCTGEVAENDVIVVDADGEPDEYGGWRDLSTVRHAGVCPPEE